MCNSFDCAENMIERARMTYGETNNRFFLDNVLDPKNIKGPYDAALCVRVLMNLRDLGEQKIALYNVAQMLRPGGRLILIEGFRDGFDALNQLPGDRSGLRRLFPPRTTSIPTLPTSYPRSTSISSSSRRGTPASTIS